MGVTHATHPKMLLMECMSYILINKLPHPKIVLGGKLMFSNLVENMIPFVKHSSITLLVRASLPLNAV